MNTLGRIIGSLLGRLAVGFAYGFGGFWGVMAAAYPLLKDILF